METVVRRHAVWACVAVAYLVVFPYYERLNNPNENVRVWMTRAIVAHGTFAIDAVEREWGGVSDRATDGRHHFSGKAPGTSLLGVPVAFAQAKLVAAPSKRATTWALRVFTVALPLAFFLLVFARAVERETGSPAARDLLVLGLGLGTMLYPYGLAFVGHAQTAALLFGGYLATRARRPVLAGLLVGLAVVFEYPAMFAALAVTGYAVHLFRRQSWRFVLGALGPALLLGAFHTALFGRPWEVPPAHVDDPIFALYHAQGLLGFVSPRPGVLVSALVSTDYGLFVWSPFLLLGLGSAVAGLRRAEARAERITILAVTVVMLVYLSGLANWRGGWCAGGPRYIAVVVPFLAWAVALSWRFWQRPVPGSILAGLVVASVFACLLAGAHFPHYPLQLDDPLFDLTLPLLAQGYAPYSLGRLLGLRGLASYLPLALAVIVALVLSLRPLGKRAAISVVVGAAVIAVIGLANGRRTADEEHAISFVRRVWEPGP